MLSRPLQALAASPRTCDNQRVTVEEELHRRALDGDGRAFATLVEPHLAMMYRLARRSSGNPQLAEDAVQEALTLAFRRLDRYTPDTSLRAFLATIAIKQSHTLLRSERRRRAREDASAVPERPAGPADIVEAERLGRRVRAALEAMPPKRREAALLRLDGGLSYADIAAAIGSTEGSTRVLVHQALKELKSHLADLADAGTSGDPS